MCAEQLALKQFDLAGLMPPAWHHVLSAEFTKPYLQKLTQFLTAEMATQTIYPGKEDLFSAFQLTHYENVRVLILGQDPYHGEGQAHGLSFSVRPGVRLPPSLKNIFKELQNDLSCKMPNNGFLEPWARQGVLLLNAVLTVRAGAAASHKNQGWERFTDGVIAAVNLKNDPVVFVLWGDYARKKRQLIDESKHSVIEGIHPSPLSARGGFFGSRPFSKVNESLQKAGYAAIDWQIPDL